MAATATAPAVPSPAAHPLEERDSITIRFAGDSGDGMQLAGTQFTNVSAILGNDISTLPDFPAEIRAPPAPWPASPASRSTSAATTFTRPATSSTRWSP